MIRGKCPTCGKSYEVARIDDQPGFPFCSERCKLIDLGRWIDGANKISTPLRSDPQGEPEDLPPSGDETDGDE